MIEIFLVALIIYSGLWFSAAFFLLLSYVTKGTFSMCASILFKVYVRTLTFGAIK